MREKNERKRGEREREVEEMDWGKKITYISNPIAFVHVPAFLSLDI